MSEAREAVEAYDDLKMAGFRLLLEARAVLKQFDGDELAHDMVDRIDAWRELMTLAGIELETIAEHMFGRGGDRD